MEGLFFTVVNAAIVLALSLLATFWFRRRIIKKCGFDPSSPEASCGWFYLFLLFSLVMTSLLGQFGGYISAKNNFFQELCAETDLHQVPVKGEKSFNARAMIKYKDGKIDGVYLVKGTTVIGKDRGGKNDK